MLVFKSAYSTSGVWIGWLTTATMFVIAEITETVWLAIIAAIGTAFASVMSFAMAKISKNQKEIRSATNDIHTLVNNDMHLALLSNANLAQKLADMLGTQEAKDVATRAKEKLIEHDKRQAEVDARHDLQTKKERGGKKK